MFKIYKKDFSGVKDKDITDNITKMSMEEFLMFYSNLPELAYEPAIGERSLDKKNLIFYVNDLEKVKYLIEEVGIAIKLQTACCNSVIFGKNKEVTEYYVKAGFPPYLVNMDKISTLSWASSEVTKFLLEETNLTKRSDVIYKNIMLGFIDKKDYFKKANYLLDNHFMSAQDFEKDMWLPAYIEYCPEILGLLIKNEFCLNLKSASQLMIKLLGRDLYESAHLLKETCVQTEEQKKAFIKRIINDISGPDFIIKNPYKVIDFMIKYLDFPAKNYINDGKPWFFNTQMGKEDIEYYDKNNINLEQEDDKGNSLLVYASYWDIKNLLQKHINLLSKLNHNKKYFIEVVSQEEGMNILSSVFRQENIHSKIDYALKHKLVFPLISQGRLLHYIDFLKRLPTFETDFIEWQKNVLNEAISNDNQKKIVNQRI